MNQIISILLDDLQKGQNEIERLIKTEIPESRELINWLYWINIKQDEFIKSLQKFKGVN